jgi:hypothetical protein
MSHPACSSPVNFGVNVFRFGVGQATEEDSSDAR